MAIPRKFQGKSLGRTPYATAAIQGTGVNPIHSIPDSQGGRNIAPDGSPISPAPGLVEPQFQANTYGFTDEDVRSGWDGSEAPNETGMGDRPALGQEQGWRAQTTPGYPGYQPSPPSGVAKGEGIRSEDHGAEASTTSVQVPFFSASAGWQNKRTGMVIEPGSGISDPEQYTRQTSMQQLHQVRAGSQRGNTNRIGQSKQSAPIDSRVPGMKLKIYADAVFRRRQMRPRPQRVQQRPFWNRRAGTGHVDWLDANGVDLNIPLDRQPPPDPYTGPAVGAVASLGSQYGYTEEDYTY